MSQSLANIVVRLVFSTKSRHQLLRNEGRGELQAYITGILNNHDSPLIEIKREDFQTEYRRFCEKNGKPLDERYARD